MKEENLSEEKKENGFLKKIFKKKEIWISGLVGLVIGGALIYLLGILGLPGLGHETIAKFKGGKITKTEMYNKMNKYFPIDYILEEIDLEILRDKYILTEEQNKEIEEEIDSILNMYGIYYGYTEEEFLEQNGFDSKADFVDYLELDYKRNLYCIDYFKTLIPQEDIQNYYNENVDEEINTKHILVEVSEDVTEEQALSKANEILDKLNSGISFDDVVSEYEDEIISEEVDVDMFSQNSLVEEYITASRALEKDTYTKEPVKTEFGYHIIYCIDKKDKPSLKEVENDIVEILGEDLEAEDQYIKYKALIKLREDAKLKFTNKDLEEEYEDYCEEINNM